MCREASPFLDVRLLPSPEPFQKIQTAISTLEEDQFLHVLHRREPVPLFEYLRAHGFGWRVLKEDEPDRVHLLIWRSNDPRAEAAALAWSLS